MRDRAIKNLDGTTAATIQLRYTLVFNGITLNVPRSAVSAIEAMPQVKKVHANGRLYTMLNKSVDYINAPKVYGAQKEVGQADSHLDGYEGQGVNISIIDTGVDWTHPMFGGDPTPPRLGVAPPTPAATSTNKKVIYYLPLTDIAANDGFGHGTHVGSTAAGYLAQAPGADGIPNTADDVRLYGVAPQAKLMSYKVCSDVYSSIYAASGIPLGGCEAANTIMALEDSVSPFTLTGQQKPVAHVINMSLGGGGGPDNPTAVAASNAALAGAIVVASSGNSGPGEGTTGSPAAGTHVISVAANTHPGGGSSWSAELIQGSSFPSTRTGAVSPASSYTAAAGSTRITLFPMSGSAGLPAGSMAQRYVYVNNPTSPVWPVTVAGRIALVRDALGATIFDIVAQAKNAGAVGVILFDDRGTVNGVRTEIPAATIAPADGEILVDALSSTDDNNVDPANGAMSELPVRMNPFLTDKFMGEVANFSSRGPVQGLGQIKPDISAPGVQVFAAVPPASLIGALAAVASPTSPNYYHLDGTSMSSPHVAGSVALIRQAHTDWTPDMVRTVLINTATNMRNEAGAAKADNAAESILEQGGGLIDVYRAVNAKALMGIEGDGITTPGILGSYSFGEVPVVNSRTTHTIPLTVVIRDLSGQGGTYNLRVVNNRGLERNGVSVNLSSASVNVPANGSASYTVSATVDGNVVRDITDNINLQWYVAASRADGGQTLRSSFFMKPSRTLPTEPQFDTQTTADIMPAMDAGNQVASGVTYKDFPIDLDASALALEGRLEFLEVNDSGVNDMDFYLFGPDDATNPIAVSGVQGGPEYIKVVISKPGRYTFRVTGYANAPATDFTLTTTKTLGSAPPTPQTIAGDFTNAEGKPVDFDGAITLSWQPSGGETGYEVERSTAGAKLQVIASTNAGQTSLNLADQPNGENRYRVRGLTPGQIGSYVTAPSEATTVIIDRRGKVDITSQVASAMSNVSFAGGIFTLDLDLTNNSTSAYVPLVELNVVRITSTSGTVVVKNADNNANGKTAQSAALFGYSNLLGSDEVWSPAEKTGKRTLVFQDNAAELFSFDVAVTAFQSGSTGSGAGAAPQGGSGGTSGGTGGAGSLLPLSKVMRITVNPLTKSVTAKLL